jgi:hypothetical protein
MANLTTTCDVYPLQARVPMGGIPVGPRTVTGTPAALQQCRTTAFWVEPTVAPGTTFAPRYIYTGKGTDIRYDVTGASFAYLECPSMSGCFYEVVDVQDMFKGSSVEQRRCACYPISFPSPIP